MTQNKSCCEGGKKHKKETKINKSVLFKLLRFCCCLFFPFFLFDIHLLKK